MQQFRLQNSDTFLFQGCLFFLVRGVAKDDDRNFAGSLYQLALHGNAQPGVQYHTYRLRRILTAAGEHGVICQNSADAHADGSHTLSRLLDVIPGSLTRYPPGRTVGAGNLAVCGHGIF